MDKEAKKQKTDNPTQAASSDAPNLTTSRVASRDAPRRSSPEVTFQDAPTTTNSKDAPNQAASSDQAKRKAARDAPNRAASQHATSASKSTITTTMKGAHATAPRTVPNTGKPKKAAPKDATVTSASEGAASAANLMGLTQAAQASTPSTSKTKHETTMDMSALKNAIQVEPIFTEYLTSSKKRRLKKARAAAQRAEAADAARQIEDPNLHRAEAIASAPKDGAPTQAKPKRSLKPRGRKKPIINTQKNEETTKGQKRIRPEDTVTPTGESKRIKPSKPRLMKGTSVSYAEAAASYRANELCVAVMTEPFSELTPEQAEDIRITIEGKLRDDLMADPEATLQTEPNDIRFRGRAHFADGVLKTWCEDAFTLGWLTRTVNNIKSPITDSKLVVLPQSAIPKKIPCMLYVPGHTGNTETLRRLLIRQNRHLNMKAWSLTHEKSKQDPPGTQLFFRVPERDIKKLKEQDRRIYYLMGNIYVRFLDKDKENPIQEDATALNTPKASGPDSSQPGHPAPLTEAAAQATEETGALAAMEVTHSPSPVPNTTDEECFPETGGSELSDGCLRSSPLPDC